MEKEQNKSLEEVGILYLTMILDDMWRGFKRFYWIFLAIISICASVFYFRASRYYSPVYTAYTSFVVSTDSAYGYSDTYYNKTTATQLSKTFPYILSSGMLNEVVAADLGLDYVPATISAVSTAETALFTLNVTCGDAQMAYDVLQSVVENYPVVAEYIIGTTQLTKMDESGVPKEPDNPPNFMYAAKSGAATGFGVSILILVLYAVSRHTVRREEDLKSRFSFAFLGDIPTVKLKKRGKSTNQAIVVTNRSTSLTLGESMRTIRTRLVKELKNRDMNCFMVTSAIAGEGKSTAAVNLALSLAHKGNKVVLIDADLRNPSIASILGMEAELGIVDLIENRAELREVVKMTAENSLMVVPGIESIDNPTELISSSSLGKLIKQFSEIAEYVVVDTPPCTMMSDATIISRYVQGVVLVVRQDFARIERVVAGVENLADADAQMVGYILNGTEVGITGYGYGYGYGYGRYGYGKYGYGRRKSGYGYGAEEQVSEAEQTTEKNKVVSENIGEVLIPDKKTK